MLQVLLPATLFLLWGDPSLWGDPAAEDGAAWNRFRGPNGTGIAASGSYPVQIGPQQGVQWQREFPAGHSSPVLSAKLLFLSGVEEEHLFTYAVNRASGETVWRREAPRPRRTEFHPKNHAAAASAAVDGDTVVVFFDEFGLLAYDHQGNERWRLELGPFDNVYGMGASPILVDGTLVLAVDQATSSYLLAVSKTSGEVLWKTDRPRAVSGHCTPVVRRTAQRTEVILPGSFLLDAYDLKSGEREWWVQGLPSEMKSVPVLFGDTLWIHGFASPFNNRGNQIEMPSFAESLKGSDSDADGRISEAELDERVRRYFVFFDLSGDGLLDAAEWEGLMANLAAVNSAMAVKLGGGEGDRTTDILWHFYRGIPQLPSPLVEGGVYYMLADQGGLLTTLDAATGQQIEKVRLENAVDDYYTAPVAGDGKIYLLSESGILTVLGRDSGLTPLHTARFEEPCYATPALEDGRLYLRTHSRLYCFGAD